MRPTADQRILDDDPSVPRLFRAGFLAMLPLWAGAIPFGIAYSVAGREAGVGAIEILLMSLTVFSAAAQVSAISLIQVGASSIEILVTATALNVHLPLIGASVARELNPTRFTRLGTAWLLTDATYAVAAARRPLRMPFLIGAGLSMYAGWNLGTAIGLIAGRTIPDPQQFAIDFVVPLTFLAVLVPTIRTRITLVVVLLSAMGTLVLVNWLPTGFALLLAALGASLAGAGLARRAEANVTEELQ